MSLCSRDLEGSDCPHSDRPHSHLELALPFPRDLCHHTQEFHGTLEVSLILSQLWKLEMHHKLSRDPSSGHGFIFHYPEDVRLSRGLFFYPSRLQTQSEFLPYTEVPFSPLTQ